MRVWCVFVHVSVSVRVCAEPEMRARGPAALTSASSHAVAALGVLRGHDSREHGEACLRIPPARDGRGVGWAPRGGKGSPSYVTQGQGAAPVLWACPPDARLVCDGSAPCPLSCFGSQLHSVSIPMPPYKQQGFPSEAVVAKGSSCDTETAVCSPHHRQ